MFKVRLCSKDLFIYLIEALEKIKQRNQKKKKGNEKATFLQVEQAKCSGCHCFPQAFTVSPSIG